MIDHVSPINYVLYILYPVIEQHDTIKRKNTTRKVVFFFGR